MKRVHFIAIGGSAMHNLALALHEKGMIISGSDDEIFEPARGRLALRGLLPEREGWFPERITAELDAVILGMHAKADNPELHAATAAGIPIYSYPEFLYQQAKDKIRVVIGGSHGKTTITAMVLHALQFAGIEADYLVGAKLEGFDIMVRLSHSARYMVFEGDEYLTSPLDRRPKFHLYQPHLSLISGIAWDHINVFPTFNHYVQQFREFIRLTEAGGSVLYCAEDATLSALCQEDYPGVELIPYPYPRSVIRDGKTFILLDDIEYPLSVFGKHNLLNASGASFLCTRLGVTAADFWHSMGSFRGAANRLELLGRNDKALIYKDFAHAPSKVMATVQALREQFPSRKLVACLELHTYSSLSRQFLSHYKASLDQADLALVYFNPHALSIKKLPPIDKQDVLEGFDFPGLRVFDSSRELEDYLKGLSWENSALLLMSSGNFDGMNLDKLSHFILGITGSPKDTI